MSDAAALLADLTARGVILSATAAGKLRVDAPVDLLSPSDWAGLARCKADLLALLVPPRCPECYRPMPPEWGRRCWNCGRYRLCDCGRSTGSAFIAVCLLCEASSAKESPP
jgi:hypothetical protein